MMKHLFDWFLNAHFFTNEIQHQSERWHCKNKWKQAFIYLIYFLSEENLIQEEEQKIEDVEEENIEEPVFENENEPKNRARTWS